MLVTIYQNKKMVYTGYTNAKTEEEIIKEFTGETLPTTHQGTTLRSGDVVVVEETAEGDIREGTYAYTNGVLAFFPANVRDYEPMDGVRCIMMQPGMPAVVTRIRSTLKELQRAVSDHGEPSLIEYSFPYPDECMVLGNEEAKLINMPMNRYMNGEIYCGPIYIVKDDNYGNLKDLTEGDIEAYMDRDEECRNISERHIDASPYLKYFGYFE